MRIVLWLTLFVLLLLSAGALPAPEREEDVGRAIPLQISRSKTPSSSSKGYEHPWYQFLSVALFIGYNLQSFFYELSTTTSDIVINFCPQNQTADSTQCFNPSQSSTYKKINDHVASDSVAFDAYWETTEFPTDKRSDIAEHGMTGVVGAGWPSLSRYGLPSFWMNALKTEAKRMFGIFISHDGIDRTLRVGGQLNSSECDLSTMQWHSLSSLSYWQIPIEGYAYGKLQKKWRQQAVIDTGSGWIGVPGNYLIEMMNRNNVSFDRSVGAYTIDCRRALALPVLELTIGAKDHKIFPSSYVDRQNLLDNGKCVVNLKNTRQSFGSDWVLGLPFLQSYCTSYDYDNKRLGIAENLF